MTFMIGFDRQLALVINNYLFVPWIFYYIQTGSAQYFAFILLLYLLVK